MMDVFTVGGEQPFAAQNRRMTATVTSRIGSPRETIGIATATTVGDFVIRQWRLR